MNGGTLDPSKEEDREPYFRRALKRCPYNVGQRVRLSHTHTKGTILQIIRDFKQVEWKNNQAYFLIVQWADGSQTLCFPGQLTAKRAR